MVEKLVVVIMGQDCERFIGMALESVKWADGIIYCDGGSTDNTLKIVEEFLMLNKPSGEGRDAIIKNKYDQEDKGMNGKQRNFYLQYVKQNYSEWWCLAIDADEVVEDLGKIKEMIQTAQPAVYSVRMRHFIGDLGHEDSTVETHYVPHRLFKVSEADKYPELEHSVLQPIIKLKDGKECMFSGTTNCTTIWHLAYIPNMWEIRKRYENHMRKSNMHTPEFLKEWYHSHLFGKYQRKEFGLIDIPHIILREFGVDPDEIYFATHNRLEVKHFLMMNQWMEFTRDKMGLTRPKILDMGCGWGMYGYVAGMMNAEWAGIEKSEYACRNSLMKGRMMQGDILEYNDATIYDLVLLIDVLEHLEEKDLDRAMENMKGAGNVFIISIPFEGDSNLHQDPTHRIFRSREWWMDKLGEYLKILDAPKEWAYSSQILIGERK